MSPSLVLSAALGSICGLLGHALLGHNAREIPIYWGTGVAGFFAGSLLAMLTAGGLVTVGSVALLESLVSAILSVLVLAWVLYTQRARLAARIARGERVASRGRTRTEDNGAR